MTQAEQWKIMDDSERQWTVETSYIPRLEMIHPDLQARAVSLCYELTAFFIFDVYRLDSLHLGMA